MNNQQPTEQKPETYRLIVLGVTPVQPDPLSLQPEFRIVFGVVDENGSQQMHEFRNKMIPVIITSEPLPAEVKLMESEILLH